MTPIPKPSGSNEFWVKKNLIGETGVIVKAPEVRVITVGQKTENQTGFDVQVGQDTKWFNPSNACYGILWDMLKSKGLDLDNEQVWVNQQIAFSENYAKVTVKGGSTKIQQILLAIPVGMVYTPPAGSPTTQAVAPANQPPPADRTAEIYADALALQKAGVEPDLQKAIALVKAQKGIA